MTETDIQAAAEAVITGSLAGALLLPVGAKAVLRYADLGTVSLSAQALPPHRP